MRLPTKNTMYRANLRNAVQAILEEQGAFTVQELAEEMNMRVTGNMRRQLRAMWEAGELVVQPYWHDRNSHGHVYMAPETYTEEDIPF